MPLILSGNVASATAGAYEIANSCRFNDGDSAAMEKTIGTPTSVRKFTFSAWVKRGVLTTGTNQSIFSAGTTSSYSTYLEIFFIGDTDKLNVYLNNDTAYYVTTNRVFRDISAWMHICVIVDTEQGTAANRLKLYINGVQETSFSASAYPTEDYDIPALASGEEFRVGSRTNDDARFFDGYIAEMVFLDGTTAAIGDMGEFNEDSPTIWQPKDPSGLTFGNNGFWLDFEASGNLGNDINGGTDFTESNLAATDQGTDTPTNNFCVMNPLDNQLAGSTFAEGNLLVTTPSSGYNWNTGTFGLTSGKWYFEMFIETDPTNNNSQIGVAGLNGNGGTTSEHSGKWSDVWVYSGQGDMYNNDTRTGTGFAEASANDIMGCYLDLDNNKVYWALNGTLQNSGTGIALDAPSATTLGAYFPMVGDFYNGSSGTFRVNFGNPIWSLSSGVADANGYGSFEYDPSAGSFDSGSKDFYAICTKNLAEFGG
jgi:hypothetical protein